MSEKKDMPKTKDTVLKAMVKYNRKPEVKARMKKYYEDNKAIINLRSKERYHKDKKLIEEYKNNLLIK